MGMKDKSNTEESTMAPTPEEILKFLEWAAKQPKTIGEFHLTIVDVPEPR